MSKFEEITVSEMRILHDSGARLILGTVDFRYSSGGPGVSVKLSVSADAAQNIEALEKSLAEEAISLLRELSALPDETVSERLRRGSRSYDERSDEVLADVSIALALGKNA